MILFPPCKINLGLSVLNKRADGFHNLETVMFQLPWNDILEIVKSEQFSFKSTGLEISGDQKHNLCVKAYSLLNQKFKLAPVHIHLHKIIPMGAGLGGGSSDGTYTLLILNKLFDLNLNSQELKDFALELGSDCPLFVENTPQFASGRGEILSPINISLSGKYIHLINIGIHVNTRDAFENLILNQANNSISEILTQAPEFWRDQLKNDFESTIFLKFPEIKNLKEKIYQNGAIYASMTGSGSTLYGIYDQKPKLLFTNQDKKVIEKIVYIK